MRVMLAAVSPHTSAVLGAGTCWGEGQNLGAALWAQGALDVWRDFLKSPVASDDQTRTWVLVVLLAMGGVSDLISHITDSSVPL